MTPHRQTDLTNLCATCRRATQTGCARCGVPLCDEHSQPPRHLCNDCEQEFDLLRGNEKHELGLLGGSAILLSLGAFITLPILLVSQGWPIVAAVAAGFTFPFLVAFGPVPLLLRHRHRRILKRFLKDGKKYRGLLPAAPTDLRFDDPDSD